MTLSTGELSAIKRELGYNVLTVGAEPFIGIASLFDQVIQPFLQAGAATTSSTTVQTAALPAVATLTLASATGFSPGDRVVVDVDTALEVATVRSAAGSTISVLLNRAHAGTYPVSVEGGETIVRGLLASLRDISARLVKAASSAGISKADEVEFSTNPMTSRSRELRRQREAWRDELASALGIERLNGGGRGAAVSMY